MSKRGNGEGSICERKDGRWVASISLPGGKRRQATAKTYKEARQKLRDWQRELADHGPAGIAMNQRETVKEYLAHWLDEVVKPGRKPATYDCYESIVRCHLEEELGTIRLRELTGQQVQSALNKMARDGVGLYTVALSQRVLRAALNTGVKWGLLPTNPAQHIELPRRLCSEAIKSGTAKRVPKLHTVLEPEAMQQFMTAIRGHRLEAAFALTLACGLRRGEVLALTWENIDMERGLLRVTGAYQRSDHQLRRVEPKTASSVRSVAIPKAILPLLKEQRIKQKEAKLVAGEYWRSDVTLEPGEKGSVFTSTVGTPIEPRNLVRAFQQVIQRAGLPHLRYHDLRHTTTSHLLSRPDVEVGQVSRMLGHSQISTTQNIYQHVLERARYQLADAMDEVLGGSKQAQNS